MFHNPSRPALYNMIMFVYGIRSAERVLQTTAIAALLPMLMRDCEVFSGNSYAGL